MPRVYTKKDLLERWPHLIPRSIDALVAEGTLPKHTRGAKAVYTEAEVIHAEKVMGIYQEEDPLSPAERNRLMNEINKRDKTIASLRKTISDMITPALAYVKDIADEAAK